MTERIITAMEYHIDTFTKAIPKPHKPVSAIVYRPTESQNFNS